MTKKDPNKKRAGISCPKHHHNPKRRAIGRGLIFFGDAPSPRIPMDSHDAWGWAEAAEPDPSRVAQSAESLGTEGRHQVVVLQIHQKHSKTT